jgi:pyruvate formate lyase activating enzyme
MNKEPAKLHKARFWRKEGDVIVCDLCPHTCRLTEDRVGICRGRKNIGGELWAVNYGQTPSLSLDPIEKKPLYHFFPGSYILSLGPLGCNFQCDFCQNWSISQAECRTTTVDPESLVRHALRSGSIGISYTYTEPLIWFEFVKDCATAFREAGLKNVMVSNGYVNPEPLAELLPLIDGWNVDLKSIRPEFYRRIAKAKLEPILRNIVEINKVSLLELTNLIVPGENDSREDLEELVDWVAGIDRSIPLHFSRYHPAYKSTRPPTPRSTLEEAYAIGAEKLDYVYVGNIFIQGTDTTHCPNCRKPVIERSGFGTAGTSLKKDLCAHCGHKIRVVI